jgi:uncharacterized membrane protein
MSTHDHKLGHRAEERDRELHEHLDELAEELRVPHHDEEERARRQAAAEKAGENPRREGHGIHPGSH